LKKELHSLNAQRMRFDGFRRAAEERGCRWRVATDETELFADCAGIVCSTDHYVLRVLKHFGMSCPFALAGFDHAPALLDADTKIMTVDYSTDCIAKECRNYILRRTYQSKIEHRVMKPN
jgi:DNA-binding LacI/PurR family transcriptional regulator